MLIKNKVTKMNVIVESMFDCTLTEYRILNIALAMFDTTFSQQQDEICINYKEYAAGYDIDPVESCRQIKNAFDTIHTKHFVIWSEEKNDFEKIMWFETIGHTEGRIRLNFSERFFSYIHDLKDFFTTYHFYMLRAFKSVHAIRFYEFCQKVKRMKKIKIPIEEFKKQVGYSNSDILFSVFRKRFIEPTVQKINTETDLLVSFEFVKEGRSYTHIIFKVNQKSAEKTKQEKELLEIF